VVCNGLPFVEGELRPRIRFARRRRRIWGGGR